MKVIIFVLLAISAVRGVWYDNGNFYQIYPRSFMDSNNDGVGDLKGIAQKLQYVKDLGMTGTWLSPIFKSPMADFGYDISDYTMVQPEYGSMEDFEALIDKANEIDIKIILDFVPNHTSDQHDWFLRSVKREPGYEHYYVWHPGKVVDGKRVPPNNWVSVFRGSAWEWNEDRQEYYLHAFLKEQPDLNYRYQGVVDEMKNVLRYWMRKGVAGFRIDAVPYLFEIAPDSEGNYPDEPLTGSACPNPEDDCYTQHIYTQNQPETWDMVYQWRAVLDDYVNQTNSFARIMMIEAYTPLPNIKYIFTDGHGKEGAQIPFNFELISNVNGKSSAKDFKEHIDAWIDRLPEGYQNNWVMGNHDNKRIASRFELALLDVYISWENTIDPAGCRTNSTIYQQYSRDPVRTPFPWNDQKNAGFSNADKTWLPVSPDYKEVNVELQEKYTYSHLKTFRKLTQMRKNEKALQEGHLKMKLIGNDILAYERRIDGTKPSENFVIILNFSGNTHKVNIHQLFPQMSQIYKIEAQSLHITSHKEGDQIDGRNFEVKPNDAYVLRGEASKLYSYLIFFFTFLSAFFNIFVRS
uniref:alpha-glucosidase n=1 Tax=Phlebotomus papatasi TaxID=29031 RepID=A0A1B0DQG8_PHLPP